jgi:hypothetical protein
MPNRRIGCIPVIKTTIIDFMATRLPDGAETLPDWAIRCTWDRTEQGEEPCHTFHDGMDERTARRLACFILDRYCDLDLHRLSAVDVLRPDGVWDSVPRPTRPMTAPVRFIFQHQPRIPDQRRPGSRASYL